MTICPTCATSNPADRDFCATCRAYLWGPTRPVLPAVAGAGVPAVGLHPQTPSTPRVGTPPVGTPPVGTPPFTTPGATPVGGPAGPRAPGGAAPRVAAARRHTRPVGGASIVLRLPGERPGAAGGRVELDVVPGERARVLALVRNQSDIVDNYELVVHGLPREWWSAVPGTVYLVPLGAEGAYEQEVEIVVHPPRTAAAQARSEELEIAVRSQARASEVGRATLTLTIRPFAHVSLSVRPERLTSRHRGRCDVDVHNESNAAVALALHAADRDGACHARFDTPAVELAAGARTTVGLEVRARRPLLAGRPLEHRLEIGATGESVAPSQAAQVVLRQRAWIPWWVAVAAPLAGVLALVLSRPGPEQATVPDLGGQRMGSVVRGLIERSDLALGEAQLTVSDDPPGTILDQVPSAGTPVDRGTKVFPVIAISSRSTVVPNVIGVTFAVAEQRLVEHGLGVGTLAPSPPDANAIVTSTVPAAGAKRRKGSLVNLRFSPAAPPPPNAGLLLDDGAVLRAVGVDGKQEDLLTKHTATETNPAWSESTKTAVFIWGTVLAVAQDGKAHALRPRDEAYDHPSFAPQRATLPNVDDGRGAVLAVARDASKPYAGCGPPAGGAQCRDSDLCLGTVQGHRFKPHCIVERGFRVGRIHWSPDGRTILAATTSARGFGIVRYRSAVAFSTKPSDWGRGEFMTRRSFGEFVMDMAISPDGAAIAAAKRTAHGDLLLLASPHDFRLRHPREIPIPACKVEWIDADWLAIVEHARACTGNATGLGPGEIVRLTPLVPGLQESPLAAAGDNPTPVQG